MTIFSQKKNGIFSGLTLTMSKKTVLYILPHHDDEIFVIPKIRHDLKAGSIVKIFFLTKSELRLKESKKFLKHLGVNPEDIISTGDELQILDGNIHLGIHKIYQQLNSFLSTFSNIQEIVCTAYEGGHHDHDMASVLARTLAINHQTKVLEFYLYNGHGTKGKFYKVASPIMLSKKMTYKYSFHDFIALFFAPFFYLSQPSAMAGLWPFLILKVLMRKPLTLNLLDTGLNEYKPQASPLYERWGRISQKELLIIQANFLNNYKD